MNDLFGGRELGCLGGGWSRMDLIRMGRRRERRRSRTERRINAERERRRKRFRARTAGGAYYGSKLTQYRDIA